MTEDFLAAETTFLEANSILDAQQPDPLEPYLFVAERLNLLNSQGWLEQKRYQATLDVGFLHQSRTYYEQARFAWENMQQRGHYELNEQLAQTTQINFHNAAHTSFLLYYSM